MSDEHGPAHRRAPRCARSRSPTASRDDGEILANPIGTLPMIGGRLAKATFAPELVMTDGEALLVENILPVGVDEPEKVVAGWNPYRTMFDVVWSGRRHVMMGGSQIDKYGNQNFAFIGSPDAPTHAAARHARRARQHDQRQDVVLDPRATRRACSSPTVDVVSGVGYDRAATLGPDAGRFHELVPRRDEPLRARLRDARPPMRLRSVHPGVTRRRRRRRDGLRARDRRRRCRVTRLPTDDELRWIREVHRPERPRREGSPEPVTVPACCGRRSATCFGIDVPIVQTGWAGSPGARLVERDGRRRARSGSSRRRR